MSDPSPPFLQHIHSSQGQPPEHASPTSPRVVGGGTTYKGGIKGYWKCHGYDQLDAVAAQRRPRFPTVELGGYEA